VGLLARLVLGNGTLKPELVAALRAEGLVRIAEGLPGSLRYTNFKAPGRRFHGKVSRERIGLGISERRVVAYCRTGRVKLADSPYTSAAFDMLELRVRDGRLEFHVDYDKGSDPRFSGRITIGMALPDADAAAEEIAQRLRRARRG
jgi:hypothetical protein